MFKLKKKSKIEEQTQKDALPEKPGSKINTEKDQQNSEILEFVQITDEANNKDAEDLAKAPSKAYLKSVSSHYEAQDDIEETTEPIRSIKFEDGEKLLSYQNTYEENTEDVILSQSLAGLE